MRQFEKAGAVVKLAFVRECSSRVVASGLESTIKSYIPIGNLDIDAFRTENVPYKYTDQLIQILASFDFKQSVQTDKCDNERLYRLGLHSSHIYNQQILNLLKDKDKTSDFLADLVGLCEKHCLTDMRGLQFFLDSLGSKNFFWTNQKEPIKCFDESFEALAKYETERQEQLDFMTPWDF